MQKQAQTYLVHLLRFGKRERLPNEASESLSQRQVPPLDMRREAAFFTRRRVLPGGDD